jgi:hypothetical protein
MPTPLETKALKAAIDQMKAARTREKANSVWTLWKVFHDNTAFLKAVKEKKAEFNQLKIEL